MIYIFFQVLNNMQFYYQNCLQKSIRTKGIKDLKSQGEYSLPSLSLLCNKFNKKNLKMTIMIHQVICNGESYQMLRRSGVLRTLETMWAPWIGGLE